MACPYCAWGLITSRKPAPLGSAARVITPLPPAMPSLNYNFIFASYSYWQLNNVEFKWSAPWKFNQILDRLDKPYGDQAKSKPPVRLCNSAIAFQPSCWLVLSEVNSDLFRAIFAMKEIKTMLSQRWSVTYIRHGWPLRVIWHAGLTWDT